MQYPFLIDDALKTGKGVISATTQNILMDFAEKEGASKEKFLAELQKKTSSYYLYQHKTDVITDHKCSTCGANIPVIAKHCDYCGAETGNTLDTEFSEEQLNYKITEIIQKVQKTPKSTFIRTLFGNLYILLPVLLLYLLLIYHGAEYGGYLVNVQSYVLNDIEDFSGFLLFASAFFILLKVVLVFATKGKRIRLRACKAEYEKLFNIIRFQYGENNRFQDQLDTLHRNIIFYTAETKREDTFNAIIYILFFVVIGWNSAFYVNYGLLLAKNEDIKNSNVEASPKDIYKSMHYRIKAITGLIDGPLKDYIKLDDGEYTAFQRPFTYKGDIFVNNVRFTVIKPLPKNLDTTINYNLYFEFYDKNNQPIRYPDSSIVSGFYIRNPEFLIRNIIAKNTKLLLHFNGMLQYKEDTIPQQARAELLGFKVRSNKELKIKTK
jgi:hypothetical protein